MQTSPEISVSGLACIFMIHHTVGLPLRRLPTSRKSLGMEGRGSGRGGRTFLQKGSSSPPRFLSHPYFPKRRKRSALSTTETDEKAIAAPAIMGESEGPPKILSTPAAMGRQRML